MPVVLVDRKACPDRKKNTLTPAKMPASRDDQSGHVDASLVMQQVLGKLDNVVEHVSQSTSE